MIGDNLKKPSLNDFTQVGSRISRMLKRRLYKRNPNKALLFGAKKGRLGTIKHALEAGADVNARNHKDVSALSLASGYGNEDCIRLLITEGADREARCRGGGFTPLIFATAGQQLGVVKLLLENGVDIETRDSSDMNALEHAISHGSVGMVGLLLDKGANIESQNKQGSTPLHLAVQEDGGPKVELLLDRGANIEHTDAANKTTFDLAADSGTVAVRNILLKYKVNHNSAT